MTRSMTRRSLFKVTGISFGGLIATTTLPFTGFEDLESQLAEIIFKNVPESRADEKAVRSFVADMVHDRMELLEDQNFIRNEAASFDRVLLERYVVVEYMAKKSV
ncbi:hypothetical protein [Pseudobacteriovorax antillogorgiicola]|uniref:Uncharacterized protein n=1 Tax=Pseudobacteriovorax antillogorgiicola TaxID=1513793 RepID=A0A1Y6CR72_9BACT|nr:hypothetical protein [Pseudobacteriovorax antillogorgiicola]TCS45899.1 hypothetical protein EDD56_12662 [Pseudobacteriovorax antillogorgiicola]SMF71132.1 hypothetical protein SAMN06296036_12636 [Pseudobacteriovorax antillogorgiicola]